MTRNVGKLDRMLRSLAAAGLIACAVAAPLTPAVRVAAFALPGLYVLLTALAGRCLGYRLLGRSTCGAARQRV